MGFASTPGRQPRPADDTAGTVDRSPELPAAARGSWKLDLALREAGQIELFSFPEPPPRPSRPEA